MDDFYVVLPSNSTPEGTSAEFSTDLNEEIRLDGKWKVALVEMKYNSHACTFKTEKIDIYSETTNIFISDKYYVEKLFPIENIGMGNFSTDSSKNVTFRWFEDVKIFAVMPGQSIIGQTAWITISKSLNSKLNLQLTDLETVTLPKYGEPIPALVNDFTDEDYWTESIFIQPGVKLGTIQFEHESFGTAQEIVNKLNTDITKMYSYIKCAPGDLIDDVIHKPFTLIDQRLKLEFKNSRLVFIMHDEVEYVLGFDQKIIRHGMSAKFKPKLVRESDSMYIYTNILERIHVGNTLSPLLRVVPFNSSSYGSAIVWVALNKMYVPLKSLNLRRIDIQIRNSSGDMFSFLHNSTTEMILHFMKML